MKNRTAEDVLKFTFNHLERVLKGKSDDQDGFVRKTAVQADTLYARPERGKKSRGKTECAAEEKTE